jgi:hypothetical protein
VSAAHWFSVTTDSVAWNGPICQTCGTRYLGSHQCSHEDIRRRINELLLLLTPQVQTFVSKHPEDRTANCPCRPENGGSGVCGCILSGPTVTC